jgi:hypothetical protein
MKIILLITFLTIKYFAECCNNKYRCSSESLPNKSCMLRQKEDNVTTYHIDLNNCDKNEYCSQSKDNDFSNCKPIPTVTGYHNDICSQHLDCFSNFCFNREKKCWGKSILQECKNTNECKKGYFCEKLMSHLGYCKQLKQQGEFCNSDFECSSDHGCYSKNNTCIPYQSLQDGEFSDNFHLCKSLFSLSKTCISTILHSPVKCLSESDKCIFEIPVMNFNYTTDCFCSLSESNNKYCPYDTQNEKWDEYRRGLKLYFQKEASLKHTELRYNFPPYITKLKYFSAEFPLLADSDDCVVDWVLSNKEPPMD